MRSTTALAHTLYTSPLGPIHIVADEEGLVGIWFRDQRHLPSAAESERWVDNDQHPVLLRAAQQMAAYFKGERQAFDLPLSTAAGTPFQRAVWLALQKIPFGQTQSYGALAHELDRPRAVRAVGAAVGRNPWSVVVPCHRVLGAQGALTGYAGGLHRKAALLHLEQVGKLPA